MTTALERVRWWDVGELAALEDVLFGDDAWSAATWWGELAQAGTRTYVLQRDDDGAVAGYAGVALQGADADVMTVAVAPSGQGRGLGRALLAELVRLAAAGGATQLLLEVRGDNVVAQRLYTSMGFERIALRRGYYRDADGWVMRLRPLPGGTAR